MADGEDAKPDAVSSEAAALDTEVGEPGSAPPEEQAGENEHAGEPDEATDSQADKSDDADDSGEGEGLVDADLPPPGPPPPEEPKDDCPKCPGGGAPAWMATFADMATLLMAFFVLLLSFAETEVPKFKQVAGSLKQAFGIEKIVPKVTIPMARSIMVENFTPAVAER